MSEERILCYDHKVDPEQVPTYWLKDYCPDCLRARLSAERGEVLPKTLPADAGKECEHGFSAFDSSHRCGPAAPESKPRTSLDECQHGVWLGDHCWTCAPAPSPVSEIEVVAAECHRQWAGWTEYLLSKMEPWGHDKEYLLMNRVWKERWQKQINTPYAALSEQEKESDRREARKILSRLRGESAENGGKK